MTGANAPVMRLGDVAEVKAGFGFPEYLQGKSTGAYPFYKVGDISEAWKAKQVGLVAANHYVDDADLATLKARPLPAGAIVFAKIGAAIGLNRRCVLTKPALVDNNVFGLVPKVGIASTNYLFQFMCSIDLMPLARATTVPSLRKGDVEELLLPMPSLGRQQQITDYLDEQLSRLDASVAALHRVQANLKRYRASVLKSACEGRLVPTEAELAHQEGRDFESGAQLLQRIRAERKRAWTGKRQYVEPAQVAKDEGASLPDGWARAALDELAWHSSYGTSAKCSPAASGAAVLRIPNVDRGNIDTTDMKYSAEALDAESSAVLKPGDLLIIRTNGSKALIGRGAIVQTSFSAPTTFASYLIRFRLMREIHREWLGLFWQSPESRGWIEARASTSAGQHNVSMSVLATAPIPLPPLAEQHRIVAEADRRISLIRVAEAQVAANLARAQRLRQSILKAAFRTPAQAGQ